MDASHEKFRDLYLAALEGQIDLATIDYIVVSHTEPDHSGLVGALLDRAPNAVVVGSKVGCDGYKSAYWLTSGYL